MIISPDSFQQNAAGTRYFTPESGVVWKLTQDRVRTELEHHDVLVLMVGLPGSGKSTWLVDHAKPGRLYVDATFCVPEFRAPFIEIAKQVGKPVISIWVDTSFEVCLERNAERPADRRVPDELYDGWWASLLESPPSESEGLAASWRVIRHDNVSMEAHPVPEYDLAPGEIRITDLRYAAVGTPKQVGTIPPRKDIHQDDLLLLP